MGKISKSGIASGTSGSGNISLDNTIAPSMNSAIEKIKHDQQEHQVDAQDTICCKNLSLKQIVNWQCNHQYEGYSDTKSERT